MSNTACYFDKIRIYAKSGHGGAGKVHFEHSLVRQYGGPDGGNGGNGGSVIIRSNHNMSTFHHLNHKRHFIALDGESGSDNKCSGRNADDIYIDVPIGTVVKDLDENVIYELTEDNQAYILAKGGKGGLGNAMFKSATNQTPQYAQPGLPGEEKEFIIELQLLADVGLVGLPNVGKSTLLSVISAAKPKIADYPFTTLVPQLGIVSYDKDKNFVVADLPGIIEGSSSGKGRGIEFLKHINKSRCLLYIISADSNDHVKDFEMLEQEVSTLFDKKKCIIAISKSDFLDNELKLEIMNEFACYNIKPIFFSSLIHENIKQLIYELVKMIQ